MVCPANPTLPIVLSAVTLFHV